MKNDLARAPCSLFSPQMKKKVDSIRYGVDVAGIGAFFLLDAYIPPSWHWIASVYFVLAWAAILLIDPGRLPEAATTKKKQRKAFKMSIKSLPFYLVIFIAFSFFHTFRPQSLATIPGLFFMAILYETYYRNIIQVMLRKWGIPAWAAVLLQSVLFGLMVFVNHSLVAAIGSLMVAVLNGRISYKTRSVLWNTFVLFIWLIIIQT